MIKKIPEVIPLDTHPGETKEVIFNAPMRLRVVTRAGGVIDAVISPSHPLKLSEPLSGWDLESFDLHVEDDLMPHGPKLVRD